MRDARDFDTVPLRRALDPSASFASLVDVATLRAPEEER